MHCWLRDSPPAIDSLTSNLQHPLSSLVKGERRRRGSSIPRGRPRTKRIGPPGFLRPVARAGATIYRCPLRRRGHRQRGRRAESANRVTTWSRSQEGRGTSGSHDRKIGHSPDRLVRRRGASFGVVGGLAFHLASGRQAAQAYCYQRRSHDSKWLQLQSGPSASTRTLFDKAGGICWGRGVNEGGGLESFVSHERCGGAAAIPSGHPSARRGSQVEESL